MRQHPKISNVMNAWITTKKKVEVVVYEPLPGQGDARILSIGGKEYTE